MPPTKKHLEDQPNHASAVSPAYRRIVKGARSHFFAHGFRGVTMDDLAAELGMSKKTLYAHFPSKTVLLEAVLEDKFETIDEGLGQATAGTLPDIPATMHQLLGSLQRSLQEIQPPFIRDMHRNAPDMFKSIQNRRRAMVEKHFGKVLAEGRRQGIVRKDLPIGLMIEILLGTLDSIINPAKMLELQMTPDVMLATILKVFFHGVITRPPKL